MKQPMLFPPQAERLMPPLTIDNSLIIDYFNSPFQQSIQRFLITAEIERGTHTHTHKKILIELFLIEINSKDSNKIIKKGFWFFTQ